MNDDNKNSRKKLKGYWNAGTCKIPVQLQVVYHIENPFLKSEPNLPPPKEPNCLRFVCISDTHCKHGSIPQPIPDGDVLLHGDFSMSGLYSEVSSFNNWLGSLPHHYKIVIAGNHDITFDKEFYASWAEDFHEQKQDCSQIKSLLTNCTYLEDTGIIISGIKIYGSPWQPEFGVCAFQQKRGPAMRKIWNNIPTDTDVLLTHSPPSGNLGGFTNGGMEAGCNELLQVIQRVKPLVHVSGHIHEGYGAKESNGTLFVNASTCDLVYQPIQAPIVFDIEL